MAKKVVVDKNVQDITKLLKTGSTIIGSERGIKSLKTGNTEKVFLASNCAEEFKEEIKKLAKLSNAEVVVVKQPNEELGTLCKKPFAISMLSVVKKK